MSRYWEKIMSKRTVALLSTVVVLAIGAVPASAASDNHTAPGTPETKNCSGQTVAFIAQIGAEAEAPGVAGIATAFGLTVQEVHALIGNYCAS
jgi:hypothetical protein